VTRLLGWLGSIGADPDDDVETRTRKAMLVHLAVLILPISLVWGVLYLALGALSGVVAFACLVVSVVSIGVFTPTRNFELLLRMQLLNITLAPTLSMFPNRGLPVIGRGGPVGHPGAAGRPGVQQCRGERALVRPVRCRLRGGRHRRSADRGTRLRRGRRRVGGTLCRGPGFAVRYAVAHQPKLHANA
jgi:hypothetical protein